MPIAPLAWNNTDRQAWQAQLEQQAKTLRAFVAEQKTAGSDFHPDDFLAFLEKQATEVDAESLVTERLLDASKAWSNEQYLECYRKYQSISVSSIRDLETHRWLQDHIDYAKGPALYRHDKQLLLAELGPNLTVQVDILAPAEISKQLDELGAFLQQHPTVPEIINQSFQEHVVRRHQELYDHSHVDQRKRNLAKEITALSDTASLAGLRDRARKIAVRLTKDDNALRTVGRETITAWLAVKAFPLKQVARNLQGNQELVGSDGKRKLGDFVKTKGETAWKVWRWDGPKDYKNQPDGEERIRSNASPETPKYIQWADRFNHESRALIIRASRPEWRAFFQECEKTQRELAEYQRRWGTNEEPDVSCRDWSFLPSPTVLAGTSHADLAEELDWVQGIFESN